MGGVLKKTLSLSRINRGEIGVIENVEFVKSYILQMCSKIIIISVVS